MTTNGTAGMEVKVGAVIAVKSHFLAEAKHGFNLGGSFIQGNIRFAFRKRPASAVPVSSHFWVGCFLDELGSVILFYARLFYQTLV